MQKLGFIGLGIMGKPMAKNLLKAGYELVVYDINEDAVNELVACGAEAGLSSKDVASRSEVVITMLPNSPEVKEVVLGKDGVAEGAKPGTIVIDMSSISPIVSQEIAEKLGKREVIMLDAPVSGGEPKAIDGTLAIMVGGPRTPLKNERYPFAYGILCSLGWGDRQRQCYQASQSDHCGAEYRGYVGSYGLGRLKPAPILRRYFRQFEVDWLAVRCWMPKCR